MPIPRPYIRVPDGRIFYGRWPQSLGTRGEAPYIAALARHVRGVAEVTLVAGRADVATNEQVFEVEPARQWRRGAQQAFAYGGMTGLRPVLALFGPIDLLPIYLRIRDKMTPLELWAWRGRWEPVTSRRTAVLKMPDLDEFPVSYDLETS